MGREREKTNGMRGISLSRLTPTDMRMNLAYIWVYVNTMSLLFNMLLPFAAMGAMNYVIHSAMGKQNKGRKGLQRAVSTASTTSSGNGFGYKRGESADGGEEEGEVLSPGRRFSARWVNGGERERRTYC